MCGVVGYIGKLNIKENLLYGLEQLEYRGYDSAGIAILNNNNVSCKKVVGSVNKLKEKFINFNNSGLAVGIGHTRWATHGKPSLINAHPHVGKHSYLVHNGIIENYRELRSFLEAKGINFISSTDSEVALRLFEYYQNDMNCEKAVIKMSNEILGSYTILLITEEEPDKILYATNKTPLIIGLTDNDEIKFASSLEALGKVSKVYHTKTSEVDFIDYSNFNKLNFQNFDFTNNIYEKDGFDSYMEKEIYQQSELLQNTIANRLLDDEIKFTELDDDFFTGADELVFCCCGTSYHAALAASYLIERIAKIKTSVEFASELRYRNKFFSGNEIFIVVSQSGETADTLEALRIAKVKNLKTLAICNVVDSSMVRLADKSILTKVGIEKGVASTKSFSSQFLITWMLAIYIAQKQQLINKDQIIEKIKEIKEAIKATKIDKHLHLQIKEIAEKYLNSSCFFFLGKDIFYPLALEGSLKLKEISYKNSEGLAFGEMKHGHIALADKNLTVFSLLPKNLLLDKTISNVQEIIARDAKVITVSSQSLNNNDFNFADFIKTKTTDSYMVEFFSFMVIIQLISVEFAKVLGNDVDKPRNLAKSVTVE